MELGVESSAEGLGKKQAIVAHHNRKDKQELRALA